MQPRAPFADDAELRLSRFENLFQIVKFITFNQRRRCNTQVSADRFLVFW
jgi:hypothetical protein